MTLPISAFALSFVLSLILVPVCRRLAHQFGRVAHPREDRWNRRPVALLGGVGIAASLFITAGALGLAHQLPIIVICTACMALTGLVDDLVSIKPTTKLVIQISLASALLFFQYRLNWVNSITIDSVLTLLWIVGITNAFNLLDNMDGLCGGIAVIACLGLMVDGIQVAGGWTPEVAYLAALVGAVGGFLVYNVHPASIFMGDTGSLLLGFSLGAVVLSTGQPTGKSNLVSAVAVPVLVLLIPILDTTLVTLSRWTSGRRASQGGRDHTSHRLVAVGLSEPRAVAMLWALSGLAAATSLMLTRFNPTWSLLAAVAFVLGMVLFAVYWAAFGCTTTPRLRHGTAR